MSSYNPMAHPSTMADIRRHAVRLTYLGCPDKIRVALANEYGANRTLPSRSFLAGLVEVRKAGRSLANYAQQYGQAK